LRLKDLLGPVTRVKKKKKKKSRRSALASRGEPTLVIDSGMVGREALVRSDEERRCSILGPTQSHISPSILVYEDKLGVPSPFRRTSWPGQRLLGPLRVPALSPGVPSLRAPRARNLLSLSRLSPTPTRLP